MKRIAVTGASGYIGSRLVDALLARPGVELVLGLDVALAARPHAPAYRFECVDVCQPFGDSLRVAGIDTAVHLAFRVAPNHQRAATAAVNVGGTRNFLDACRAAGVRRSLVLGSTTAYGAWPDNPPRLTEASPLRADAGFRYSFEKRLCDEMCRHFAAEHPEIALVWARSPIVVGPHVDNYITRIVFKPKVAYVRGDDPEMQFVHEDDLAGAILALLEAKERGPFNIAPEGTVRFLELVHDFKRKPLPLSAAVLRPLMAMTYHARLNWLNEIPPGGLNYIRYAWVADGEKLRRVTGFQFTHTTRDAIMAWRESVRHRIPRLGPATIPCRT